MRPTRQRKPPPRGPRGLLLSACCAFGALATGSCETKKDEASEPSLAQRLDTLEGCVPSDLEVLLPWTGPAFDPTTGRLSAPLPAGHVEAVAQGWRNYGAEATALRQQQGALVAEDVFGRAGLLGFQAVESVACDISMSHTLWRDQASMLAFVTAPAHAAAMASAGKMHHRVVGAHWTGAPREQAPTWRQGIDRLISEVRARAR
jgi:hypothetical protein